MLTLVLKNNTGVTNDSVRTLIEESLSGYSNYTFDAIDSGIIVLRIVTDNSKTDIMINGNLTDIPNNFFRRIERNICKGTVLAAINIDNDSDKISKCLEEFPSAKTTSWYDSESDAMYLVLYDPYDSKK